MKKQDGLKKTFVHTMQRKIFSGEFPIGQLLPSERELAAQFNFSRSLVNSGILELSQQGFIRIMPRRGSIVADYMKNGTLPVLDALISNDSIQLDYPLFSDLIEMHLLIESECARLASQIASQAELKALRMYTNAILEAKHPLDAVEPVVQFHRLLTQCSGNSVYIITMNSFESFISRLVYQHYSLSPDMPKTKMLHDTLMRSLEARDAEASARNIRLCMLHGTNTLKELFQS